MTRGIHSDSKKEADRIARLSFLNKGDKNPMSGRNHTNETRKLQSEKKLGSNNPMFGRHHSDLAKEAVRESKKGKKRPPFTEEHLKNMRDAHGKGENSPRFGKHHTEKAKEQLRSYCGERASNWKGGISFEPYCVLFNDEFRERVRAFFGYCCPECGTPQNGRRLGVHHVEFNKSTCCDDSLPLFVPLCMGCHNKTQRKRQFWQEYFTDMIMDYYGGKCYLTKQEMANLQGATA